MHIFAGFLLAVAPQTIVTPSETLFCDRMLRDGRQEFSGLARLETDKDGRTISSVLTVHGPGYSAEFKPDGRGSNVTLVAKSIEIDAWPLPKTALFPVVIDLSVDGVSAGQFTFGAPDVRIVDTGSRGPSFDYYPAVSMPKSLTFQGLWGFKKIKLLTHDVSGKIIDHKTLIGPDWQEFLTFSNAAFSEMELQRTQKGCEHSYHILVID